MFQYASATDLKVYWLSVYVQICAPECLEIAEFQAIWKI